MHSTSIQFRRILLASFPLLLAFLLYGYTLRLPLFLDDGPNFWFVENIDGVEQWRGSVAFPYYRPVAFSLWKISQWIMGCHHAAMLHLLNVISLGLTGVLTGQIARRLYPGQQECEDCLVGLMAGVIVILVPFSYQAVTLVSALFHLTLALGLVASIWFALRWLDGKGGALTLGLCWASAVFGVFSHENGPMLAPLLVLALGAVYWGAWPPFRRMAWVVLPVSGIAGVYTLVWFRMPSFEASDGLLWSAKPEVALAILLQGLVYPFIAVWRLVAGSVTVAPEPIIAVTLVIVAVPLVWLANRSWSAFRMAAYGLVWYGLSVVSSVLFLAPGYVVGSPRLMLLATVGAGIYWGAVLGQLIQALHMGRRARRAARSLAAGVIVLGVGVSLVFLTARRDDFLRMGQFTNRLMDLGAAQQIDDTGILLFNAPNYIAPEDPMFFIMAEGTTFMLDDISWDQQFWLNTGLDYPSVETYTHSPTLLHSGEVYMSTYDHLEGDALYDLLRRRAGQRIYATAFVGDAFWPVYVGETDAPGPETPLVSFPEIDQEITVLEARYSPGWGAVTVQTRWQVNEPSPVKVFVHVWCNDTLVGQSDGYPWGNLYPFEAWKPGESQTEYREIRVGQIADPACLWVNLGVYWTADLERLNAVDAAIGESYVNGLIPVPLADLDAGVLPFAEPSD